MVSEASIAFLYPASTVFVTVSSVFTSVSSVSVCMPVSPPVLISIQYTSTFLGALVYPAIASFTCSTVLSCNASGISLSVTTVMGFFKNGGNASFTHNMTMPLSLLVTADMPFSIKLMSILGAFTLSLLSCV